MNQDRQEFGAAFSDSEGWRERVLRWPIQTWRGSRMVCLITAMALAAWPATASSAEGSAPGPIEFVSSPPTDPAAYRTPSPGTPERAAIMDAARIPVAHALGQHVIFVVSELRIGGEWAYLQAIPHQPDGRPLDWRTTPFARDWALDMMSDVVMVLLRREAGVWIAIEHVIGPTDVHWVSWMDAYDLPEALFHGGPPVATFDSGATGDENGADGFAGAVSLTLPPGRIGSGGASTRSTPHQFENGGRYVYVYEWVE